MKKNITCAPRKPRGYWRRASEPVNESVNETVPLEAAPAEEAELDALPDALALEAEPEFDEPHPASAKTAATQSANSKAANAFLDSNKALPCFINPSFS